MKDFFDRLGLCPNACGFDGLVSEKTGFFFFAPLHF